MVGAIRDPKVIVAPAYQRDARQLRHPQHKFKLAYRPYQLQPFMIAPVLPGETMQNLMCQARVLTDPLNTTIKLVGWWSEFYWFYVKHRDLGIGQTYADPSGLNQALQDMVLDNNPGALTPFVDADGNAWSYTYPGAVDWTLQCTARVVEEYFRDEGVNWNTYLLDGVPQVAIYGSGQADWAERLTLNANKRTDESTYNLINGGILQPREMNDRMMEWATLREAGMTGMDYNDFVKTYGQRVREDETSPNLHRPELLKYERDWQYPVNPVGSSGVVSSQVVWDHKIREDGAKRFAEPGFIIGLTCVRPKVFYNKQEGSLVGALNDVYGWLPAVLQDNYERGYKQFADSAGPLATVMTQGYWIDLRDLYLYGDQFINYAAGAESGTVALPSVTAERRYAATADIDALFAGASAPVRRVYADGIVHLSIKGQQRKTAPGTTI